MKNILILLCAGKSKRFKNKTKKQYITINDKPLFSFSLDSFFLTKKIDSIYIVYSKNRNFDIIDYVKNNYSFNNIHFVIGGTNRYDSVYNALNMINNDYNESTLNLNILIHDSARPFVKVKDINNIIKFSKMYNSLTLGFKSINTIKSIKNSFNIDNINVSLVDKTFNRDYIYNITTPQCFKFDLLYKCYKKFLSSKKKYNITDDIQLVEYFSNEKSYIIDSSEDNVKITKVEDLRFFKEVL